MTGAPNAGVPRSAQMPNWYECQPVADSTDRPAWLAARRNLLTSTDIAKAATPAGRSQVIQEKLFGAERPDNAYFKHGRDREPFIARAGQIRHGIMPNSFLFVRDGIAATPDAIHPTLKRLGEYKTSVDVMPKTTSRIYRDQIYVAQHVFGADETILGWEQHLNGVPAELEPAWRIIPRDQARIDELLDVAAELGAFLAKERLTLGTA